MSPVPSEKRLQNFKRHGKATHKSLTGSNIISSKNKRTSSNSFDFNENNRMQAPRKSPKSTNKTNGKSQIWTSNKILSAKLKRRLKMIKALSDSVGEEPVVKVCSSSISECFKCSICNGYLYKATTITECLHTFCKSCIVKHFTFNLNCPKCNILIHPTDPLVNLRSDSIIQDLLYKLLPGVEKEEKSREQSFIAKMQSPDLTSIKAEKQNDVHVATQFLQHKKISKKQLSKDIKSEPKDIHVGFEINLLGCCTENFATKPPLKAYFSLPISSTMKDAQTFLEERLKIPPETQVIFFVGGYLINPLLGIEKLWNIFSNGDVLENFLSLSYAIMPLKDYFNMENCDS